MLLDVTQFILQSVGYFLVYMFSLSFEGVNLFVLVMLSSISVFAIRMLLLNLGSKGVSKNGNSDD